MESTISVIKQFSVTKSGIEDFAQKTIAEVEAGNIDPLELKLYLKAMEESLKKIDAGTKDYQLKEASKHGLKSFQAYGCKIEVAELGTKYDFSNCQDSVWNELQIKKAELDALIKEREAFLKTIKCSINLVTDDGEPVTVYAPVKSSTTGLKITIK